MWTRQRNLRPDQRYLAIEEALADLAASNRTQNWTRIADKHGVEVPKSMQSKLRAMLDNIVARIKALFGKQGVAFTDAQVLNLLENAWQAAQGNQASMSVMGADGALEQVSVEVARNLPIKTQLPTDPTFAEAVANTDGAAITKDGLEIDLVRYQKPEQAGNVSVRTGVFYLPTGSKQGRYYRNGAHYGGKLKVQGRTLIKRPLFAKGGTGGKAPESAYDALRGKGAYQKMRDAILKGISLSYGQNRMDAVPQVRAVLEQFGADPSLAYEIVLYSAQGNTLAYALQENIVAHAVREAGYDAVVGWSKGKAGPFVSEVFDVREATNPTEDGESDLHPAFENAIGQPESVLESTDGEVPPNRDRIEAFRDMTREQFLGYPKITSDSNASGLEPTELRDLGKVPMVPFMRVPTKRGWRDLTARYDKDGAAVYDGDRVIASYNFGDTLVVDKAYRRKTIAEELVYQWRTRNPNAKPAKYRTRGAQSVQEAVWGRIQRDLRRIDDTLESTEDQTQSEALESVEDVRDEAAAREGDDGFSEEGRRQAYDGLEPVSDDSAPAADERASMPPVGPVVDLPSRRPGESQQDYTRRISRRGGSELRAINAEMARMRKIGRANFRAMLAKQARMADVADAVFHEYRTLFDKADRAALLDGIDQWETGRAVTDPDLRNFFSLMDGLFAERIERLRAAKPDALKELVENYFPHIWEDTGKAEQWYSANTKRPLDGNKSFLKQRTWGTIREGMASGLRPVSYNPVDLALLKLGQMDKFITFHEFKNDLKARGWLKQVKAGERLPEGYALIDSPAFKGSHAFVVKGDDGGADHAGTSHWNWAVPELIAKDVNNYLSPSLYRFGAWKALRYVQNVLMSTRLGFSMFHAGFTTLDNAVTHGSIGLNRLLQGDVVGAAKEFAYIPLSPLVAPYHGGQLNKMWRGKVMADPHTQALLLALEEGGARRLQTSHQQDFNNALNSIARKLRRLRAHGLVRDTEAGVRAMLEGPKSDAARAVGNAAVKQAAELIGAVGELSSWLIHQKLVPAQKMNARVSLLKFELDRLATKLGKDRGDYKGIIEAMHPDVLRQVAGRVVDNVDDRLGQMNYDNQFWPKVAREIAQATIGAVGWQVGTVRTVTGGVRDLQRIVKPESLVATLDKEGRITDANMGRLTNRVTNLLVLGALMSAASVIAQMAMTGDPPEEPKDFFFPRTGRKNRDDSDERLQFPTYWMDHYKLATHPLQTAGHKVHPSIGMALETFANKDYYGVEIRDEDAPLPTQATQIAEYFAKGFVPYSITGQGKLTENDAGLAARVGNFFGFTVAPASVSRSEFQAFVADKAADTAPRGARTQAQADKSEHMREVESELRRGESPDMSGLTERQLRDARRAAGMQVPEIRFMRLSLEDKLRGWDMATPEERARYHLHDRIVGKDREKDIARLPEGDREYVRRRLEEISASAPDGR